jgi:hypothetical protein
MAAGVIASMSRTDTAQTALRRTQSRWLGLRLNLIRMSNAMRILQIEVNHNR